MKKIVFHNYHTVLNLNNFMFTHDDAPGIGEGLLKPFKIIKEKASSMDMIVGCRDFFSSNETIDAYFFLDLPKKLDPIFIEAKKSGKPLYLVAMESPIIRPDNYTKENHSIFTKIFTWDSSLVDNLKYIKINIPQNPSPGVFNTPISKRKLITQITSKKKSHHPGELYSKRIAAIEFFEKNYPNDFDLYGNSWDKDVYTGAFKFLNLINRLPINIPFNLQPRYTTYRGKVVSKIETLSKYKFSICFENFSNSAGYITEKIFDCFYASCIPVYWGAPDILEYIPENTFIDMRNFSSFDNFYSYIKNMPDSEIINYQKNIRIFLESNKYKVFLPDSFADILLGNLEDA